jgi:hypothetical protein
VGFLLMSSNQIISNKMISPIGHYNPRYLPPSYEKLRVERNEK